MKKVYVLKAQPVWADHFTTLKVCSNFDAAKKLAEEDCAWEIANGYYMKWSEGHGSLIEGEQNSERTGFTAARYEIEEWEVCDE